MCKPCISILHQFGDSFLRKTKTEKAGPFFVHHELLLGGRAAARYVRSKDGLEYPSMPGSCQKRHVSCGFLNRMKWSVWNFSGKRDKYVEMSIFVMTIEKFSDIMSESEIKVSDAGF